MMRVVRMSGITVLTAITLLMTWAFADFGSAVAANAPASSDGGLLRKPTEKTNWVLERHEKATAELAIDGDALKLDVDGGGGAAWHIQLYEAGLDLTNGVAYIVRFRAKSTVDGIAQIYASDMADAHNVGLVSTITLGTDWKDYELPFTAKDAAPLHSRAPVFALGKLSGTVWIDHLSITRADGVAVTPAPAPTANRATPDFQGFPFAIPWDDAVAGTATDVSFLNDVRPAGAHGRIVSKDGHFIESNTGRRVKFLGINMGAEQAFPTHEDADKIAAALAKYGINVVRLHHMDNSWATPAGTLIDRTRPDRQHFVPEQLDKLDYLVAALSRNGIYSNINLKVSHDFTVGDGFPASVQKLPWLFDKRVDIFCRRMIDLQKDYARLLLTHKNPYTQMTYATDPAVAFIEINNENSILGNGGEPLGRALAARLPEPFAGELAGYWNAWLKKKYASDDALSAAWKTAAPSGPSLISPDTKWTTESRGQSKIQLTPTSDNTDPAAAVAQLLDVKATDGPPWNVQTHLAGLNLQPNATYTLNFRAKAEQPRTMTVTSTVDQDDWHNLGLSENASIGKDWQTYTYVFDAQMPVADHSRIAFVLGNATGKMWIADLTLKPGAIGAGPKPGESLAAGNLTLPVLMSQPEYRDWVSFLANTEHAYADEMRSFLRHDLGVTANLTDTQVDFGGLTGVEREAGSDYIDAHAYWQHPSFGHGVWSTRNWSIENSSMVSAFVKPESTALGELAFLRVADKPFMVSEYDHPAPTDYAAEMMPLLATFTAEQDWDGVYLFSMGPYGAKDGSDHITGFFDDWDHPAKRAFLPTAALTIRGRGFPPEQATKTLQLPLAAYLNWPFALNAWHAATSAAIDPLTTRLAITLAPDAQKPRIVDGSASLAEHPEIRIVQGKNGPIWLARSKTIVAAAGYLPGYSLDDEGLKVDLAGGKFAALTLASLDGAPIDASHRLLLTIAGNVDNPGMGWNASRTSVSTQWGHGPSQAEYIDGTITLSTQSSGLRCFSLDAEGKRSKAVKMESLGNGQSRITFDHSAASLWYELSDKE